jgi:hypothetical protein
MSFYEELQELVRRTRNNPELFHRLVYEPETVLNEIGFLSEDAKRQILGLSPAELTAKLLGCEAPSRAQANQVNGDCAVETCGRYTPGCTGVCSEASQTGETPCGDCTDQTDVCGCTDGGTLCAQPGTQPGPDVTPGQDAEINSGTSTEQMTTGERFRVFRF